MAQESCNLDKEEAEILKPSSSPSSPPSPTHKDEAEIMKAFSSSPTHQQSSSTPLFTSFRKKIWTKRHEKLEETIKESKTSIRFVNRCLSCRRKVGLTGFRCRCGHLFCGQHRYSDSHDCSFDYKALGREQISKANPIIRAAKIIKI